MDRDAAENARQLALFDEPPPAGAAPRRRVLLAGQAVEYRFERRRRRTIGISVSDSGVAVAAPLRAPMREIEAFLIEKQRWILAKLEARMAAGRPRTIFGESGETLPLFGREVVLAVVQGPGAVALDGTDLRLCVPEPHRRGAVRARLIDWLKSLALEALTPRAAHFAARLGLPAPPVALSRARTQWGVCMGDGRIRLSWRLVHLAPPLADYVVAHEVAHLVELNHSERFWALVQWLYPDWRGARESIERDSATIPKL